MLTISFGVRLFAIMPWAPGKETTGLHTENPLRYSTCGLGLLGCVTAVCGTVGVSEILGGGFIGRFANAQVGSVVYACTNIAFQFGQ
jgi:hypothetical protein